MEGIPRDFKVQQSSLGSFFFVGCSVQTKSLLIIIKIFLIESCVYLKLSLLLSLLDILNYLQCLSRFRIAFNTPISNQGLVLDFSFKVLISETESTADKNLLTKPW